METIYKCSCHLMEFKTPEECLDHERIYAQFGSDMLGKMYIQFPTNYNNSTFIYRVDKVTDENVVIECLCVKHEEENLSLSIYEERTTEKEYFLNVVMAGTIPIEQVPRSEIQRLREIIKNQNIAKVDMFLKEAESHSPEIKIPEVKL